MAFQLNANEPVSDGIGRNARSQIEKALTCLSANKRPPRGAAQNDAVHEVRKCFKRVRAALRMVREDLGDDLYHEENFCFRDAARPLTEVRDAEVLVETADKLGQQFPEAIGAEALAKIHGALLAHRRETAQRVLVEGRAFAMVEDVATRALARLPAWRFERDGWAAIEGGLRHVYRAGHHALARAAESPGMENLHEWRKQAKYLWHLLQLLEGAWTGSQRESVDSVHKLSTLLGEDHDLAVLRQTLAADPLAYGGHRVLKGVFVVVDRARGELEERAFALGGELYRETPREFTVRIGTWMTGGRPHEEKQPIQKPVERIGPGPAAEAGDRQSQAAKTRKRRG